MRHTDWCGICGETYDSDNLATCRRCGRDFCHRCGDMADNRCRRCREEPERHLPEPPRTDTIYS